MEPMPDFRLLKPATVDEAAALAGQHEGRPFSGGGTDIIVNLRRGIGEASALIDLSGVEDLGRIETVDGRLRIGAAVRLADIERDQTLARSFPAICGPRGRWRGRPTGASPRSAATSVSTPDASTTIRATGGARATTTA